MAGEAPDTTLPAATANPNPPAGGAPPPSAAADAPTLTADMMASLPPPSSSAITSLPPAAPTTVTIQHRGGFRGLLDEFRDAVAGTTTAQITTDAQGNKVVTPVNLTHGQQWARIAAQAAHGALAGYAAGQGPGGGGRAGLAGIQAGTQDVEQRQKQERDQQVEARAENLERYNNVKQKLDLAQRAFELKRLGVTADQTDTKFSQDQLAREKELGSIDLGLVPDHAHMSDAAKNDPKFFQHLYTDHSIVGVEEIGPNGERMGLHVFLRTTKPGDTIVPAGTEIHRYVPPLKPGDQPQIVTEKTAGPMKQSEWDSNEMAVTKQKHDWTTEQHKDEMTAAQLESEQEGTKVKKTEETKNKAEAAKAYADAAKARAEAAAAAVPAGGGDWRTNPTMYDSASGLADGRYMMGKDFPTRTTKEQTTAAQHAANANQYSMEKYGIPYSPVAIRQEDALARDPKIQTYLTGIDRMIGTPGVGGQLDQVLDLAKKAGLGEHAPLNQVKQWVKEKMGVDAAKDFETAVSDTQKSLTTLIGNPLLGGGESDLRLKEAQRQFGSNPTVSNLRSTSGTIKEILERSRAEFARNNRFIQQRYGSQYSPPPRPQQQPQAGPQGQQPTSEVYSPDGKTLIGHMYGNNYVALR